MISVYELVRNLYVADGDVFSSLTSALELVNTDEVDGLDRFRRHLQPSSKLQIMHFNCDGPKYRCYL